MLQEDIRRLTRAVPFQPFKLYVTTGDVFEVRHPEMIIATPAMAHIAVPAPGGPSDVAAGVQIVSLFHIQKFEFLPSAPISPGSNGPPKNPGM